MNLRTLFVVAVALIWLATFGDAWLHQGTCQTDHEILHAFKTGVWLFAITILTYFAWKVYTWGG